MQNPVVGSRSAKKLNKKSDSVSKLIFKMNNPRIGFKIKNLYRLIFNCLKMRGWNRIAFQPELKFGLKIA
jgi:hypothetical protein